MSAAAAESVPPSPEESSTAVDDRNPWIGLASFTEETRGYFYGRDTEVSELARRVQRKLLTVLFGQSGLGKTSILRAGLVPRLRSQGYCPVYVRVDYSRESPDPAEQIKQAIARTARRSGQWTQVGVAAEGESLWEFLHHRDDVLRDETGKTLIPLVIFDQFEEVFTVAQADDFGRSRATRFIQDLADLVENRPPAAIEAKLEADDTTAERFDFARSDYRVLIALREDYLAQLESLKGVMPSVTQNRLRLARMSGTQALAAVLLPGKQLVSDEVAAAIVRFVAGGAELANAEVEPSLLSLICRELNDTRVAQGRAEISLDLLAGSHATILSNFYERALTDQPPAVRRIIEDELLTDSGYRENIAEERLRRSFSSAGAIPETLSTLVNRRLLRIEERLDVRRVELTHDVLCSVVRSSRDVRQEREAREATERSLAQQQDREQAARAALVRARQVATVCIVLAIGAIVAAIFAYWSTQRAKRAESVAQQSRVQAEQLLGYLTDDFARQFESVGRVDAVASLAEREINYFQALPDELKGVSTTRTHAVALTQFAKASVRLGNAEAAKKAAAQGQSLLEGLRTGGDHSPETTIALARSLTVQARLLSALGDPDAVGVSQRAVDLVGPLAQGPQATRAAREAHVAALIQLGYQRSFTADSAKAIPVLQQARQGAASLGGKDLKDLQMADSYIEATAWIVQIAVFSGDADLARRLGAEGDELADKILLLRPSDMAALYAQGVIQSNLTGLAVDEMQPQLALEAGARAVATQQRLVALDQGNIVAKNNLAVALGGMSDASWALGRPQDAIGYERRGLDLTKSLASKGARLRILRMRQVADLAVRQAYTGDLQAASATAHEFVADAELIRAGEVRGSPQLLLMDGMKAYLDAQIALVRGDGRAARDLIEPPLVLMSAVKDRQTEQLGWIAMLFNLQDLQSRADFMLADYESTEQSARTALEMRKKLHFGGNFDALEADAASTMIGLALIGQGRAEEARSVLNPVVKRRLELQSRNHGDNESQFACAVALYAEARAEPDRRVTLLKQSAALIDAMPRAYRALSYVRYWRAQIGDAQRGKALASASAAG